VRNTRAHTLMHTHNLAFSPRCWARFGRACSARYGAPTRSGYAPSSSDSCRCCCASAASKWWVGMGCRMPAASRCVCVHLYMHMSFYFAVCTRAHTHTTNIHHNARTHTHVSTQVGCSSRRTARKGPCVCKEREEQRLG